MLVQRYTIHQQSLSTTIKTA